MRAAQIENNIVINYAEVENFGKVAGFIMVDPKDSILGATYDPENETFINPVIIEEENV